MKKFINDIVKEVREAMYQSYAARRNYVYVEREYQGCLLVVDIQVEQLCNGYYFPNIDVDIQHDNCHTSPRLVEAIRKALPDWFEVGEEVGMDRLIA